ncbi:MAG: mechanosensitive ion channel family protein [Coleofasciculus sp. Co-bin14]|nr:mechanosensitive ion channel family protein [Coleofasciculus sp. Co-bin14]
MQISRFVVISLLAFILTITWGSTASGQAPTLPSAEMGNIVSAPVILDGRELFQVSAVGTSNSQANSDSLLPLGRRVEIYENNLEKIVQTGFDPKTLSITTGSLDGQTVIFASDRQQLSRRKILAISELDARIHGLSLSDWTEHLTDIIQIALIRAQQERQPSYLQHQAFISVVIVLGMALASLVIVFVQKGLKAQCKALQAQQPIDTTASLTRQEEALNADELVVADRSPMIAAMEQKMTQEQQYNANTLKRGVLQVAHAVIWLAGLTWIFGLFPYTRPLQTWLFTKWTIVGIVLGIYLAIRAITVLIDGLVKQWLERRSLQPSPAQRRALRVVTFSHLLKGVVTYTLVGIGIIWVLSHLHIPTAPLLATAGIFGFAISFGSQNLVRDVINGTLIFLEDQYAIGDIINVGNARGVVEEMNLRVTQLRDIDGRLSTVPNSSISTVHNLTKDWSRINFSVEVAHEADVDRAIEVVRQTAEDLQRDTEWGERILQPADILGVNNIAHTGIELVIWIRTQPGQQWSVAREFRRRLKLAFDQQGISLGAPKQLLSFDNSLDLKSFQTRQDGHSSAVS